MNTKALRFASAFINVVLICSLIGLRYSGIAIFKIGNAVPVILLPLIVAISMFKNSNSSIMFALLTGALMDSTASDSSCFNTIFFVLAAAGCNLLFNRFLNRNIKAAAYMSFLVSLVYFFLKYMIFFVFQGTSVNYDYFMLYLIPSVVYTAVFIIPFYFLEKKLAI